MRKISGSTFYFKKVFPSIWFGFLGLFLLISILTGDFIQAPIFLVVPVFMAVIGYVMFKKMLWDLADEVYDAGDYLIFHKDGFEQVVNLKDIINIDYAQFNSPERVVIHVRNEGPLGKELAFSLPARFNPFSRSPLIRDLIERVDRAKYR